MNLAEQVYEKIVQTGWTKGEYAEWDRLAQTVVAVCLLGGVGLAAGDDAFLLSDAEDIPSMQKSYPEATRLVALLSEIIRTEYSDRLRPSWLSTHETTITGFNDHEDTTIEDIELVCRKASARLDEEVK